MKERHSIYIECKKNIASSQKREIQKFWFRYNIFLTLLKKYEFCVI